jgi:hypothetical protein
MKIKIVPLTIILIAHLLINASFGQAPQSFNYQAVARDASGLVLGNQAVSFRISLLQGSATGTSAYTETHAVTTNLLGLVNFAIGSGTVVSGNFATINWAQGPYFAQVELDEANNGTYVLMSTTQLLSVPYAQYAEKSGNPTLHAGSGIAIQNDSIVNTAQNQQVNLSGTGQTNVTGTYPNYIVNTPNIQAGNGISVTGQTITNSAPDQTVILGGTGQTSVTGTYPSFTVNTPNMVAGNGISLSGQTITNTAPDQTVILGGTGQSSVTGTYPSFTVNTPNMVAGNGISVTGQTITNTAPDQTVILNGTGQSSVTGTYPNFTVNTPPYNAGTGINISGTNISAQNTNAIWNANKLQSKNIDTLSPALGNILQYDGSKWKPSDKLPQMTTAQREALTNLYAGMTILNTNTDCIEYYNGTQWLGLCGEEGNVGNSLTGGTQQGGNTILISNIPNTITSIYYLFSLNNLFYFHLSDSTMWAFNPATNVWSQKATPPFFKGIKFNIGNNGYIFKTIYSTYNVNIIEYSTTLDTWSAKPTPAGENISNARYIVANDSVVFLTSSGFLTGNISYNLRYNPSTNIVYSISPVTQSYVGASGVDNDLVGTTSSILVDLNNALFFNGHLISVNLVSGAAIRKNEVPYSNFNSQVSIAKKILK